jgi:hypothetical protein
MADKKLLSIYLNDHLAGATAGFELAKRAARSNEGTELGGFLEKLRIEISEDLEELKRIMEALGVKANPMKTSAAWAFEKLGRLKLNGQWQGYSPLSRLIEIEGLCLGVEGKLSLWRSLEELAKSEPLLLGDQLGVLIERAQSQRSELEPYRRRAAREALSPSAR